MSLPSHLILDLNITTKKHLLPYWAFNLYKAENNPIFLNDINPTNLTTSNKSVSVNWLYFLKSSSNLNSSYTSSNYNKLLVNNKFSQNRNTDFSANLNSAFTPENLININFLRYERLYTKLKYSRSPAFDIVSGGAAALLAGFVGFLISEKFGFELVDSGDFYYLFMYGVFATFILKPLLYTVNVNKSLTSSLSPKNLIRFISQLLIMCILSVKSYFKV
jgi:hypothetical protein